MHRRPKPCCAVSDGLWHAIEAGASRRGRSGRGSYGQGPSTSHKVIICVVRRHLRAAAHSRQLNSPPLCHAFSSQLSARQTAAAPAAPLAGHTCVQLQELLHCVVAKPPRAKFAALCCATVWPKSSATRRHAAPASLVKRLLQLDSGARGWRYALASCSPGHSCPRACASARVADAIGHT